MFDNDSKSVLSQTTAQKVDRKGRSAMFDLSTPQGALSAAKGAWWTGLWLALGAVLEVALTAMQSGTGDSFVIVATIDGVIASVGVALAILVRAFHPTWAISILLGLLSLNLVAAIVTMRIGFGLVINGACIVVCVNAIRGNHRLKQFRNGLMTPQQAGKVFE